MVTGGVTFPIRQVHWTNCSYSDNYRLKFKITGTTCRLCELVVWGYVKGLVGIALLFVCPYSYEGFSFRALARNCTKLVAIVIEELPFLEEYYTVWNIFYPTHHPHSLFIQTQDIASETLSDMCIWLNTLHGQNKNVKFWEKAISVQNLWPVFCKKRKSTKTWEISH